MCTLLKLTVTTLAVAAAVLVLPLADHRLLEAQCVACSTTANCEDGGGGSSCVSEMTPGQPKNCEVSGGCECTRIVRPWWFDTVVCTPTLATAAPSVDARLIDFAGGEIMLQRVGPSHFAATQCGDNDDWMILARELPDGELAVTTNPMVIRLRRWTHGLGFSQRAVSRLAAQS